jgi:hypothetical protein
MSPEARADGANAPPKTQHARPTLHLVQRTCRTLHEFSITLPTTTLRPSSHGVAQVAIENSEVLLLGCSPWIRRRSRNATRPSPQTTRARTATEGGITTAPVAEHRARRYTNSGSFRTFSGPRRSTARSRGAPLPCRQWRHPNNPRATRHPQVHSALKNRHSTHGMQQAHSSSDGKRAEVRAAFANLSKTKTCDGFKLLGAPCGRDPGAAAR